MEQRSRAPRKSNQFSNLEKIWQQIKENYNGEWLLAMELLEISEMSPEHALLSKDIKLWLETTKNRQPELSELIHNGFEMIYS